MDGEQGLGMEIPGSRTVAAPFRRPPTARPTTMQSGAITAQGHIPYSLSFVIRKSSEMAASGPSEKCTMLVCTCCRSSMTPVNKTPHDIKRHLYSCKPREQGAQEMRSLQRRQQ